MKHKAGTSSSRLSSDVLLCQAQNYINLSSSTSSDFLPFHHSRPLTTRINLSQLKPQTKQLKLRNGYHQGYRQVSTLLLPLVD
jgi:hypothetical protein